MKSKDDRTADGIPRWAAPWSSGWSGIAGDSLSNAQAYSPRRIQRVGFAATSVAAAIWVLAIVWLWPVSA